MTSLPQKYFFSPKEILAALTSSLPDAEAVYNEPPEAEFVYVPDAHAKALNPDFMLVKGIRGAGKSLWWSALQSDRHLELIRLILKNANLPARLEVSAGFGQKPSSDFPSHDVFIRLLHLHDAKMIWKAIIAHKFMDGLPVSKASWEEKVRWVENSPEEVFDLLSREDTRLANQGAMRLIVFDALDRAGSNWSDLTKSLRGLLQNLLEFRSFKAIRAKAFVRPDMIDDPQVINFPDASKILSSAVDLHWPRYELYNILWQSLANAKNGGGHFRSHCASLFQIKFSQHRGIWYSDDKLRFDEELQREVFHAITGPWMGKDARRGFPYTWLPGHLGDARGQTSPRSFIVAIRTAADHTQSTTPPAVDFRSIKAGIQGASQVRVNEVKEDFPWIEYAMKPLSKLVIPCTASEIYSLWRRDDALRKIKNRVPLELQPRLLREGFDGLTEELMGLAIFLRMSDGRINIPDVYRVGFGLGRKGGVTPL